MRLLVVAAVALTIGLPAVSVQASATAAVSKSSSPLASSSGWKQYRQNETHAGFNPDESTLTRKNVARLRLAWTRPGIRSGGLVEHGKVVSCRFRWCTVRQAANGKLLVSIQAEEQGAGFAIGSGNLYTPAWGLAFTLDGGYLFSFRTDLHAKPDNSIVVHANRLYQLERGHLYAFDATDGTRLWERFNGTPFGGWCTTPAVADGLLFVTAPGYVAALRPADGHFAWKTKVPDSPDCSAANAAYADGKVVVAGDDVTAYDAHTGAKLWSTPGPGGAFSAPAIAYGLVYLPNAATRTLNAYSLADGHLVWTAPLTDTSYVSPASVANGVVYVSDGAGLHTFATHTGRPLSTLAGKFFGEPVVAGGSVVLKCGGPYTSSICVYRP